MSLKYLEYVQTLKLAVCKLSPLYSTSFFTVTARPSFLIFKRFLCNIRATRGDIFRGRPVFLEVICFPHDWQKLPLRMRSADEVDILHFSAIFRKLSPDSFPNKMAKALFSGDILLLNTIVY